jgi:glycine/D-amino acid oxidase-like deaminating enzyme
VAAIRYEPFWWDAAPRPVLPEQTPPARADAVVIGSGYTGLSAALTLARAGRSVLVLEAEAAGAGASSRNQGQIGAVFKRSFGQVVAAYGKDKAVAIFREGHAAVAHVKSFIEREQIECHLTRCGRFVAAYRPEHYEAMARELDVLKREVGFNADMVPAARQHDEVVAEGYFGGQVRHDDAMLHSALYHQGLLDRVRSAGVPIATWTPAEAILRESDGFRVKTPKGEIHARNVVLATNGHTGRFAPWFRRRVIPMGAYGIVTEELPAAVIAGIIPRGRMMHDTRKLIHGIRLTPDGRRVIFGGRASMTEADPRVTGPRLYKMMVETFPVLAGVRITHSWMGYIAFTFSHLPHTGVHDGVHFSMGYCGSGVALGSYMGHRLAQKILGDPQGATAFDDLPFETRPLYTGTPWFAPPTLFYYRFCDRWPPPARARANKAA